VEWEEANRYPFLAKLGQQGWQELAKTGKATVWYIDASKLQKGPAVALYAN